MHGVAQAGTGLHRHDRPSAGTSSESACGPMSQSAPCSLRQGEAWNGLSGASAASQVTGPPASVRPGGLGRARRDVAGWNRKVKKTTEATPAALHGVDQPVGGGDVQGDRLLQQQVLARRCGAHGQRRLHVRRERDRDGVDLGQQLVDVGVPGDVELRADRLGLREVPAPDPDQLRRRVRGQRRGVDLLRPEAGAEDAEPHGQTAPNWRSPASPRPGTM